MEYLENLRYFSCQYIIFFYGVIIFIPLIIISCIKNGPEKEKSVKSCQKKVILNEETKLSNTSYKETVIVDKKICFRFAYILQIGIAYVNCVGCSKKIIKDMDMFEAPTNSIQNYMKSKKEKKQLVVSCFLNTKQINDLLKEFKNAKDTKLKVSQTSSKKPVLGNTYVYRTDDEVTGIDRVVKNTITNSNTSTIESLIEDENMLGRIIQNGPRPFDYKFDELADILRKATNIVSKESCLIECSIPCAVYGDIHGQYSDLFRWFQINGWPSKTKSIFLGDYVDRGIYGVEVIGLLCALKIEFPDNIYLIRGNHEEERINRNYEFYHEVLYKFGITQGEEMFKLFSTFFSYLPLSGLIGGKILCMHGGISPKLTSLDTIRNIIRPISSFTNKTLACDLVWSDPCNNRKTPEYTPNFDRDHIHGIGQLFTTKAIENTIQNLNIDLIIRAHQVPLKGITSFANGKLLTVFSAPGYQGDNAFNINWGASLFINEDFNITINKIRVTRKCRMNRIKAINARKANKQKILLK
ncbi:Serine/threonine-protein phosphatase PP1-beta catalytic subunit [Strongyloides ratti]|uniref:Serine/threonine-protein phosphatase n=1 Tax=Strongyloides ratti TaxID=34506 RepID=A0A090L3G4_STRRB|nr:Serine/threonine-protein phosphatase PP1-beta catalytic subunit [Strongyloides ratti]CEF62039.1 Serine/threonine-protein phosphatase PP1-beta catalytic subunit [Strongyloides ratti]